MLVSFSTPLKIQSMLSVASYVRLPWLRPSTVDSITAPRHKTTLRDCFDQPDRLSTLPEEILIGIFERLESPRAFAAVCRRFNALANDPRSIASWLLCKFGPHYAVYYALIAMPSLCNGHFIHCLVNRGGLVPRGLIQKLVALYGKPINGKTTFDHAVSVLPFTGYVALINVAGARFGDDCVAVKPSDHDAFVRAFQQAKWFGNMGPLTTLLNESDFVSTPVAVGSPLISIRNLLWLRQTHPDLHNKLFPVFEIDPSARQCLWESVLLLLLDLSFTTAPQESHHQLLQTLSLLIHPHASIHLAGAKQDQDMFEAAVDQVFSRFPAGYCTDQVMTKLLGMLTQYVIPCFSMTAALHHFLQQQHIRPDIRNSIYNFLHV